MVCTPLGPERTSFLQLLWQQAVPRAWGREPSGQDGNSPEVFTAPRARRELGRPCSREAASPKCTILGVGRKTFSILKMHCPPPPNYFIIRITAKEIRESSIPGVEPSEAGTRVLRNLGLYLPLGHNPSLTGSFLSYPLSPSCVLQLQHKLFAWEVSLYDPIQHTQEKTVGDRPDVPNELELINAKEERRPRSVESRFTSPFSLLWVEEKKKGLFGSNIFGERRENKNTAGPWREKLSVPAQGSRGRSSQALSPSSGPERCWKARKGWIGRDYPLIAGLFK